METSKPLLLAVVGPTAIGKTVKAIELAEHFKTEIISADSRQFYKEMQIGTAVPSKDELARAKHHFIQHISIETNYTVGDFERDALAKLTEMFKDRSVVILVGGSGLYINAVLDGLDQFPEVDTNIRIELNRRYQEEGINYLQEQLQQLDPDYYGQVDLQNPHRLIRALEICLATGKPYSGFRKQQKAKRDFDIAMIGLEAEREVVYDRINRRVDIMMSEGLLDEAKKLYPFNELNALQTVGYKELFKYLDGQWDLPFAVEEIKKNSRRFAKRQFTWFKKDPRIMWFDYQTATTDIISQL